MSLLQTKEDSVFPERFAASDALPGRWGWEAQPAHPAWRDLVMKPLAALLLLALAGTAVAQTPYGYGLGTTGYGHGLNGGLSGRAAGPGGGSQAVGGDGVLRGGSAQPDAAPAPDVTPGRPVPPRRGSAGVPR